MSRVVKGPEAARRRTVLHLIDTGGPGGAETVFVNLVAGLDPERWRQVTAVPDEGWIWKELRAAGNDPHVVPSRGAFDLGYLRRIVEIVRREGVELIHAHLLGPSVYGSMAGRLCGVPVVCTFHGKADVSASESYRAAKFRIINRRRNRIVFVADSLQQTMLAENPIDVGRTRIIRNGIDARRFRPEPDAGLREELGIGPGEVLVGAVGNVRVPKAYPDLLQAVALLRQRAGGYHVVIVGDDRGPLYEELVKLRARLGLEGCVHFTGFRDDIPRVMNNLDVYVISSRAEGLPLSTLQAMASGVPVVATRCGGPEELIEDGVNGRLVPVADPAALSEAIHAVAGDPDARRRFARAGRRLVEERFTTEGMLRDYEDVYAEVLGLPRAHADEGPVPAAG